MELKEFAREMVKEGKRTSGYGAKDAAKDIGKSTLVGAAGGAGAGAAVGGSAYAGNVADLVKNMRRPKGSKLLHRPSAMLPGVQKVDSATMRKMWKAGGMKKVKAFLRAVKHPYAKAPAKFIATIMGTMGAMGGAALGGLAGSGYAASKAIKGKK